MELINCNLIFFPLRLLQCQLPKMTSLIYLLRCKVLKLLFSITYTNPDCVYLLKESRDSETKSECGIMRYRKNYEVHGKKQFVFILFFGIILFIFGSAGSSLLHGLFLQLWQVGDTLQLCAGFSLRWLLLLQSMGSRVRRLQQLHHMGSVVATLGSRAQAQQWWHTGLVAL